MIPVIKSGGVTSKAGFQQGIDFGAREDSTNSAAGRSSISISAPVEREVSRVVKGDAMKKGTLCAFAIIARLYVPILFAVDPSAQTRSAPTTQASAPLF